MVKLPRFLLLGFCVLLCPAPVSAQDISSEDVARVAEQFNQMSEQDKAILLNVAKQKYDALSPQEKEEIMQQAKQAVAGTPYENQVLPLERKLRGDDIPEAMKMIEKAVGTNPQAVQQPSVPVQPQIYQKPPIEQVETFIQENQQRFSDNQKKGMQQWKEHLEEQEKMHEQYMKYLQEQGRQ